MVPAAGHRGDRDQRADDCDGNDGFTGVLGGEGVLFFHVAFPLDGIEFLLLQKESLLCINFVFCFDLFQQ